MLLPLGRVRRQSLVAILMRYHRLQQSLRTNMLLCTRKPSWSKRLRLCQLLQSPWRQTLHCMLPVIRQQDAHLWNLRRTVTDHPGVMSAPAHLTPCLHLPWPARRLRGNSALSMSYQANSADGSTRHLQRRER